MQHPELQGWCQQVLLPVHDSSRDRWHGWGVTARLQMTQAVQQRTLRAHMRSAMLQLIHHTDCGGQHAARRHPELVRLLSRRLGFVW